jgi:hypothetical protein
MFGPDSWLAMRFRTVPKATDCAVRAAVERSDGRSWEMRSGLRIPITCRAPRGPRQRFLVLGVDEAIDTVTAHGASPAGNASAG